MASSIIDDSKILEEGSLMMHGGEEKEPLKPGLGIMDDVEVDLFESEEEDEGS